MAVTKGEAIVITRDIIYENDVFTIISRES